MKGYKVNRDRWRDCHGLPVEKAVEKALGIDGKKDIEEKLGVEKFTEACRAYVGKTSDEWRIFVDYIGRWADMDHAYYTMNLDFMESVIWVFQTMYNQNLVYKGFKVQRCCPSCATSLSNSEVNEGYKDRQDTAITIKFKVKWGKAVADKDNLISDDGFVHTTRAVIKDKDGKILALFDPRRGNIWWLPGWRPDTWETPEIAVTREVSEELWVKVVGASYLGAKKLISSNHYNLLAHYFEIEIDWIPTIQEASKHEQLQYIELIDDDNDLWFAVKIENTLISDTHELLQHFNDFYTVKTLRSSLQEHWEDLQKADVNILAWTTTPRTLPSNMFLAVGRHIHYAMVYDKNSKEYYVIAEALLKQYYKNPEEYLLINIIQWSDLEGISYEPLFPYIHQSAIAQNYKDQFFKIIAGEFVSTEDGTGIVHIAPGFGMEDFDAVAQFLPRDDSKNWLFMPVNEYGEFTDEVPDYKGQSVFDVNKEVITRLKNEKKLIGQKSYSHSYPHCRRCETPLISRALTSRFIKEPELTSITVPNAAKINFVPESVKNRFIDTLKSAPDRNLSRNRYRWSPLPIWENQDNTEDKIVIGNLDELYQQTKTWSKNLTKHILVRHAESEYNPFHKHDSYGNLHLSELGKQQAQELVTQLPPADDCIIVLSPLSRTLYTALPYLQTFLTAEEIKEIEDRYMYLQKEYQELRDEKKIQSHLKDNGAMCRHRLHNNVYMDRRITDVLVPELQDTERFPHLTTSKPTSEKLTPLGESMDDIFLKVDAYMDTINALFPTKTIITFSHKDAIVAMKRYFKHFDFLTQKDTYTPENALPATLYRDYDKKWEVDLHKPYVDNYWFMKDNHRYNRIPEVMDCWFESGSMPFGQANYIWKENSKFVYPAEFIIEGLDQTRGWFRTLHVCGNAVMKQNSFNNVVINGLILAEDGRKMSKSLNNYPDPKHIFETYGSDAYRLYLLASPGVRAEPMRFSEKWVDQVYKDFTAALMNSYKFFETYAKVDNFVYDKPTVYFLRHGEQEKTWGDASLSPKAYTAMQEPAFVETILRTNPEIIYTSQLIRAQETAKKIQEIMKTHRNKDIEIVTQNDFADVSLAVAAYEKLLTQEQGKCVLIVGHEITIEPIWSHYYQDSKLIKVHPLECLLLPTHVIANELDKWIISALHEVGMDLEKAMDAYLLDDGAKAVLGFIDKLNNRFIRRSRRRFWANGMDSDKYSAYCTLFEVLQAYTKLCASFAPFVSEHIYLALQAFTSHGLQEGNSVHLEHLPISSLHYINRALLQEISLVRKIISLGLFIRSKNKIAVKQPLSTMEVKM